MFNEFTTFLLQQKKNYGRHLHAKLGKPATQLSLLVENFFYQYATLRPDTYPDLSIPKNNKSAKNDRNRERT